MKLDSLHKLLVHQLKDIYSAELQIVEALPKLAEGAEDERLGKLFNEHLEETRSHVTRLERIFDELGYEPGGHKCKGAEGLIAEGSDLLEETDIDPDVLDAGLVAAAQRVEHYEIAAYGCARAYARRLGMSKVADLLGESLEEESAADEKLTRLAEGALNAEAVAS